MTVDLDKLDREAGAAMELLRACYGVLPRDRVEAAASVTAYMEAMHQRAEAAEAALAECRKDAERYRWLIVDSVHISDDLDLAIFLGDKETADHLIDAAIQEQMDGR